MISTNIGMINTILGYTKDHLHEIIDKAYQ